MNQQTAQDNERARRERVSLWFERAAQDIVDKNQDRPWELAYLMSELVTVRNMLWDVDTAYQKVSDKISDPQLAIYTTEWLPGSVFKNVVDAVHNIFWILGGVWIIKFNGATITYKRDKDK